MEISFFSLEMADTTKGAAKDNPGGASGLKDGGRAGKSFADVISGERTRLEKKETDKDVAVKDGGPEEVRAEDGRAVEDGLGHKGRRAGEGESDEALLWKELTGACGLVTSTGATARRVEADESGDLETIGIPSDDEKGSAATEPVVTVPADGFTTEGFTGTEQEVVGEDPVEWADAEGVMTEGGVARSASVGGTDAPGISVAVASASGSTGQVEGAGKTDARRGRINAPAAPGLDVGEVAGGTDPDPGKYEVHAVGQGRAMSGTAEAAEVGTMPFEDGETRPGEVVRDPEAQGVRQGGEGREGIAKTGTRENAAAKTEADTLDAETPEAGGRKLRTPAVKVSEDGTTATVEETVEGAVTTVRQSAGKGSGKEAEDGPVRDVRDSSVRAAGAERAGGSADGQNGEGQDLLDSDEGGSRPTSDGKRVEEREFYLSEDEAGDLPASSNVSGKGKAGGPARIGETPAAASAQSAPGDAVRTAAEARHSATAAQAAQAEPAEVYEKFTEGVRISLAQGGKEVKLKLHPESLGKLHIKLSLNDAAVTARVVVENPAVKALLEGDSTRVREMFASQGLSLDDYSVELSADSRDGFTGGGERYGAREGDGRNNGGRGFGHAMDGYGDPDDRGGENGPGGPAPRMTWPATIGQPVVDDTVSRGVDVFA